MKRADGEDKFTPSRASLSHLFTLTTLIRITVPAVWSIDGLLTHHFQHLRCLELVAQVHSGCVAHRVWYTCPQTDKLLMPLVKPVHIVVDGREQRQAARAAKRAVVWTDVVNKVVDVTAPARKTKGCIPFNNAANFPSLECLALPYKRYNRGSETGEVSAWMMRHLRRSYEYEVAAEWEAECTTLGNAKLLKSIAM